MIGRMDNLYEAHFQRALRCLKTWGDASLAPGYYEIAPLALLGAILSGVEVCPSVPFTPSLGRGVDRPRKSPLERGA